MAITILRPCFVVGPGFDNPLARYLQKPVVVLPLRTALFQFVHEDDLLRVMLKCLEDKVSGVFNVAGAGTITFPEAVAMLGNRALHLPLWLLVPLNTLAWHLRLRLITEFPSSGFNLIRYPWIASPQKLIEKTGFKYRYDSRLAFADFVRTVNQ